MESKPSKKDKACLRPLKIKDVVVPGQLWGVGHYIYVWRRGPATAYLFTDPKCKWAVGISQWSRATEVRTKADVIALVIALKLEQGL
jgi:hypothetical protein